MACITEIKECYVMLCYYIIESTSDISDHMLQDKGLEPQYKYEKQLNPYTTRRQVITTTP